MCPPLPALIMILLFESSLTCCDVNRHRSRRSFIWREERKKIWFELQQNICIFQQMNQL